MQLIANKRLKGLLWWGALVGFFVPIFWGAFSFLLFNARETVWTTAFWNVVYVTCPPWRLNVPSIFVRLLNAALYVLLIVVFLAARQVLKGGGMRSTR